MSKNKSYGHVYDKQGNLKEVSAPVNAVGDTIKKHTKTKTGKLHDSVGFAVSKPKSSSLTTEQWIA